jgi:outer membrane protein
MIPNGIGSVRIALLPVLVVLLSAGTGFAQAVPTRAPATQPPAGSAVRSDTPQAGSFAPDGVSLEDAVRMTLAQSPSLKLSESAMRRQQGVAQEASGLFDLDLKATGTFERVLQDATSSRIGDVDLQLPKYFRMGLLATPFARANTTSTSPIGSSDSQNIWTFTAGINFTLPLSRGRGATAAAAGERAAQAEALASELAFEHQAAVSALSTIRAYWDARAEEDSLAAARHSLEVAARVAVVTKSLVSAEELPRIELARAQAGEARARSSVSDAERRVRDARVALVKAIGVTVADGDAALPRAKDAFPVIGPSPALRGAAATTLAGESLGRRRDVGADQKLDEAGRILEAGAVRNQSLRFDLTGGAWMTALGEDTISRAMNHWEGPSVSAGVELETPFGNNSLRGQARQRSAEARQRQISLADLSRQVRLDVLRVAAAVGETAERVEQAEVAVDLFRKTVDAEIERFKVGETTLIDTLQSEQQMTDALLTLASAKRDLAQLVAELRFQTGTLVPGMTVAGPNFITLPSGMGK